MSRAKEIQEKLALQAKLQDSFANSTSKVLSWLQADLSSVKTGHNEYSASKDAFFQLPVMQTGSGLNLNSNSANLADKNDIHTVGEFIKSDKKVNSLSKKKKRQRHNTQVNSIYRVAKDDTEAMTALKRKMRKTQRENVKELPQWSKRKEAVNTSVTNSKNESDDSDDEPRIEKSTKKQFGLLFNNRKER